MTGEKSLVNGGIRNGKRWSMGVNERMRIGVGLGEGASGLIRPSRPLRGVSGPVEHGATAG
jgi:hypothetical protein